MTTFEKAIRKYIKKENEISKTLIRFSDNIIKSCKKDGNKIYIPQDVYDNIKTCGCINVFREINFDSDKSKRIGEFLDQFNLPNKKVKKNETLESVLKLYEYYLLNLNK